MDSDGDPHPHTPGDPHPVLTGKARKKARKKARRQEKKKLRRKGVALELEQGPSELQTEDPGTPQVGQISPLAALATGSHGHPETPAPVPTTNLPEKQVWRAMRKAEKQGRMKLHLAIAIELERGPSEVQAVDPGTPQVRQISLPPALATGSLESPAPDTQDIEEQAESLGPEPARLRQSFLYSHRPRRFKRPTSVQEHVREVSSKEFEALALDQSPPTPDSTHRVEKHDSTVSNRELEERTMHRSPPARDSTPSIEDYASEVRALKLARSPPTFDSTHRSYATSNSETGSEIVQEKPQNASVPWADRHLYIDIVELLIAHEHGYSDPAQHKLDAEAYWAAGEKIEAPKVSESLASLTGKLAQGEASTKEIIENGKKWMGEEVMLAFEKYIKGKKQFKDVLYCLDELQQQCFSVESYNHIFHHFNFTVKTKKSSDDQWSSALYFAEVKQIYGRKYYFCYELHSYDDGHCYACKNQGMHTLQHPICEIGYEGGHAAMGAPFVYFSDDDDFD